MSRLVVFLKVATGATVQSIQNAFLTAELLHSGWAVASERVLASYGTEDVRATGGLGYHGYSTYVRNQAGVHYLSEWRSRVDGHGAQVPYNLLQSCPSSLLKSTQLAVLP